MRKHLPNSCIIHKLLSVNLFFMQIHPLLLSSILFLGFPFQAFLLAGYLPFQRPPNHGSSKKNALPAGFFVAFPNLEPHGNPPKSLELLGSKRKTRKINCHPWLQPTTFVEAKDKDPILLGAWRVARRRCRGKKYLGNTEKP